MYTFWGVITENFEPVEVENQKNSKNAQNLSFFESTEMLLEIRILGPYIGTQIKRHHRSHL
mgnify:CR=1 FL=1